MIRDIFLLALFVISLTMMTACTRNDYADLEAFIHSSGDGLHGRIDSLPEVRPHQYFTYEAFDISSPFVPRKNDQAQTITSGIQPDLNLSLIHISEPTRPY